ncbi:phosphatase PAP2 family protein [Aggregatilinea lenta]|uniref:phosphatase PAP2 family protein n=1 Tax=Aggregatilinea lenta TaxID=913108 RepID=UPI0013C2D666|nr:phosphatase PAP2 family protein [Aggregatilinea lenta]
MTNGLNSTLRAPTDGWELKIAAVDNHLTPQGIWLIPYAIGFVCTALVPLWAAYRMPIKLYRQFILAMIVAALFSYVLYMAVPTYVVKPHATDVAGNDIFSQLLRHLYDADNDFSTHNAAPSQHVFYAIIIMCFMIRFRPNSRSFITWTIMGALVTVSALLTRQHHSPDLIAGYAVAVGAYYAGLALGERATFRLGDEAVPLEMSFGPLARRLRTRRTMSTIAPE